jgi:septal ring factor EnvC (AmiA/AmiB activator)
LSLVEPSLDSVLLNRLERRFVTLTAMVANLTSVVANLEESMSQQIDALTQAIQDSNTQIDRGIARLQELSQQILDASGDQAAVTGLTQQVVDETNKLRAALPEVPPAPQA